MALRHVPARTCVACRNVRPKRELVRIVRTNTGSVMIDPTGKQSGRGTYLCRDAACWRLALRRNVLGTALKTELRAEDRPALEQFADTMTGASLGESGGATR